MAKKKCNKCGKEKSMSAFWKHRRNSDGLQNRCIDCSSDDGRTYYMANKERIIANKRTYQKKNWPQIKAQRKEYRDRVKLKALVHYSDNTPSCDCCGETTAEFLTLDHIDGGGNKHRRELGADGVGFHFYRWLKKNNYPPGLRVLCMNCNWSLGMFGYCPHEKI